VFTTIGGKLSFVIDSHTGYSPAQVSFKPDRLEKIRLAYGKPGSIAREVLEFTLPLHQAIPFHWWMHQNGLCRA